MRHLFITAAGLSALLAAAAPGAEPVATGDAVALKAVNYADLVRTVRDLQGKVVVVDFWGEF